MPTSKDIIKSQQKVPAGTFHHQVPREILVKTLINKLESEGKYHCLRERKKENGDEVGGTRISLEGEWGLSEETKEGGGFKTFEFLPIEVMIKADKSTWEVLCDGGSQVSIEALEKGNNTKNEAHALLSIPHPDRHHLARVQDVDRVSINGESIYYVIERKVPNGKSIQVFVDENGPLNSKQFIDVFSNTIDGVQYFIKTCQRYHRDINPSNIVVAPKNTIPVDEKERYTGKLEATVIDLANSCPINAPKKKPAPTAGARKTTDPFLFEKFTGQLRQYDEKSEIYSIGSSMYFALTGKYPFIFDYTEGNEKLNVGIDEKTISLLDKNGKIDKKIFIRAVEDKLHESGIGGAYGRIIKKCLLSPLSGETSRFSFNKGYQTINELVLDFRKLTAEYAPIKRWKKAAALISLVGAGFLINGAIEADKQDKKIMYTQNRLHHEELKSFDAETKNLDKELVKYDHVINRLSNDSTRVINKTQELLDAVKDKDYDSEINKLTADMMDEEAQLKKARLNYQIASQTYSNKASSLTEAQRNDVEQKLKIGKQYIAQLEELYSTQIKPAKLSLIEEAKRLKKKRDSRYLTSSVK